MTTGIEALKKKANELWETIVHLETEKYDLEERSKRQDYDVSVPLHSLCSLTLRRFLIKKNFMGIENLLGKLSDSI